MYARHHLSRLLLAAILTLPLAAHADVRYTVTAVGGAGSIGTDINNLGVVVGNINAYTIAERAFVNYGSGVVELGTLGGSSSRAEAINDIGQIVGAAETGSGSRRAFLYAGGAMNDLGTIGGGDSFAFGINNAGTVVGGSGGSAFMYAGGVMSIVEALPAEEPSSTAFAINAAGTVVGASTVGEFTPPEVAYHAFSNTAGVVTDLGTFGGQYSRAEAINDLGQIVGTAATTTFREDHAFLYSGGVLIDLGTLPTDFFPFSTAYDINRFGQVVGWSTSGAGSSVFLYEGAGLLDLNLLIDPASGWNLVDVQAINDLQQIAGTACKDGECFAVRLDPIPEPATYGMLLTGLGLLAYGARRGRTTPFT